MCIRDRGQTQAAVEVAGVEDVEDHSWWVVEEEVTDDALLFRGRGDRVGTGKIDEFDVVLAESEMPDRFLDGHSRPVANILVGAGQTVEKGRFASIGNCL